MKKFYFILSALFACIFTACLVSCSDDDDEGMDYIKIVGTFRYDGNVPEIMDAKDFYDVVITENTITTTPMFNDEKSSFTYTRKGNKITITPAMNGKLSSATIVETSSGIGFSMSNGKTLFFTKR